MSNLKNFPIEIKNPKIKNMESFIAVEKEYFFACGKTKESQKPVIVVSTHSVKGESEITNKRGIVTKKPNIIHEYNNSLNGCDQMDQMILYYNVFNRKTIKWWKRMFMWCFEVSQMNVFILFCLTRETGTKTVQLIEFKKLLITELITEANKNISPDQKMHRIKKRTGDVVRTTQPAHCVVLHPDDRSCAACSTQQLRKRTKFKCETCHVYLHTKDCFKEFHSKEK